jgi:hypothetical protein
MQSVLGKTPPAYFQDLRVERAEHLMFGDSHAPENIDHERT